MKKLFFLLTITASAIVTMQSCKKENAETSKAAITQTVNVQLAANESYTFILTKNTRDDEYRFVTQAQHASVSSLGVDANGNRIYKYTPELNYAGTDLVVVSNDWERNEAHDSASCGGHPPMGNCGGSHHGGNCGGGEEDHYIVTLNFVTANSSTKTYK